jgi:hypothetical protein
MKGPNEAKKKNIFLAAIARGMSSLRQTLARYQVLESLPQTGLSAASEAAFNI